MADLRAPHLVHLGEDSGEAIASAERNFSKLSDFLSTLLSRASFLDGILHKDVSLAAGATTQIEHKLGRTYLGYIVTKGTVNADYPGEGTSDDETQFLALTVSAAQTVDVWVF